MIQVNPGMWHTCEDREAFSGKANFLNHMVRRLPYKHYMMITVDKATVRWYTKAAVVAFFCCSALFARGQKYSNEFLSIGVGARAQGLGNAVIARTNDANAAAWNPAGLAADPEAKGWQIAAMHSEWFAGVGKFDYLGAVLPAFNNGRRIGISLIRFGIDDIPNTLSLYNSDGTVNFDNVSQFSAADYALLLSYAQPLSVKEGRLVVGGNVKVIHRIIGPFANSWGFGLDLGLQYHRGNWSFGATGRDLSSTFNAWSFRFTDEEKEVLELTNNEVPINSVEVTRPTLIAGVAHRFRFKDIGLTPELDVFITTDGRRNVLVSGDPFSIDPAFGLEADYRQFIFLRAGVNQFQQLTGFGGSQLWQARPALGVGFVLGSLTVDYAFSDQTGLDNGYSHVISLQAAFSRKKS